MVDRSRRRLLHAVATSTAAGLAGCLGQSDGGTEPRSSTATATGGSSAAGEPADATPSATGPATPAVGLETVASGLGAPVDLVSVPGADRRYVLEQSGTVHVHESDGLRDGPLLDLGDAAEVGGEKGLLGAALHPDYPDDRRLFVRYSAPSRAGTPDDYSHTFVLAAFDLGTDGLRADRDSERTLLEIPQPQGNHNAGDLAFGPDGYLYVAVGDGGAGGDRGTGHVEDWYDAVAGGNGQDVTENLLGSILRIDVDAGGLGEYGIPEDNPLVGDAGLDEHYAWGLRNPWRMSFDGETLIAGDVGQNDWEEVDVVEAGGNYGWNVREGTHCYAADDCPDETPAGEPLLDPVIEYPHGGAEVSGVSVTGGYVARDAGVPELDGRYVFGDYQAGGRLFVAEPGGDTWPTAVLPVAEGDRSKLGRLLSFGRGSDGALYVLAIDQGGRGGVHRLVSA
jgi:glucose/arabinose dehydrogenase